MKIHDAGEFVKLSLSVERENYSMNLFKET